MENAPSPTLGTAKLSLSFACHIPVATAYPSTFSATFSATAALLSYAIFRSNPTQELGWHEKKLYVQQIENLLKGASTELTILSFHNLCMGVLAHLAKSTNTLPGAIAGHTITAWSGVLTGIAATTLVCGPAKASAS